MRYAIKDEYGNPVELIVNQDKTLSGVWQTQTRGTNDQEYEIYKAQAESLGWEVKTYQEWLDS